MGNMRLCLALIAAPLILAACEPSRAPLTPQAYCALGDGLTIQHENQTSGTQLTRAVYAIDGAPIFSKAGDLTPSFTAFHGVLFVAGTHMLNFLLEESTSEARFELRGSIPIETEQGVPHVLVIETTGDADDFADQPRATMIVHQSDCRSPRFVDTGVSDLAVTVIPRP